MSPAAAHRSPEAVVQEQLDAYNACDLQRFVAVYADDVRLFRLPATEPALVGKRALAEFYAAQRFNLARLHADLVNRIVLGNKIVDHERITGVREQPFEAAVAYEVADGLIRTVWSLASE